MKFFIAYILLIPSLLFAEKDIKKEHQDLFSKIDHISVQFKQTIYKKLRNRTINRQGEAHFSKPNYFRWNFVNKDFGNEEFYYNGKKLTHFREKEKVVTHYNANVGLAKELNEVVNLVLDPSTLHNRYDTSKVEKEKNQTKLTLSPRAGVATEIASIEVKVSDQRKYVKDIKILYMDGNYTQFQFKNPRFSANDLKIFTFSKKGSFTIRNHG
ncbi:outer membrane lipoprotein carrier protein LolA [Pseudobacteriovorax antillogorgiicola]|uniref:Outer membrane lipoprotein-sorting protein n=1 Tax=Pseudobacteriovorax antillogorgiicola TaxID=1513793 RepID=A0A1Y6CQT1_9BACT|nr:outer membrane lipoprotein carrier protein LolA [Pseudobacteriovorax antillogorgiicola]TCS46170.1 outer membrane lipoprotein-sorting protein [Pseudobacteriovorax antillogorgiicola]SMF69968.1 Outer membrane lipoprotein-sorting protein [Pseudobacteriovorax antillogorgiicola]